MTDVQFLFSGWAPVVRIVTVGTAMYVALLAVLRTSGSRTLAELNAFDFVVTVAIGAAFGRSLTAQTVALAEAVTAFATLVLLQYVVATLRSRSDRFEVAVTNPPCLLYYRDEFRREAMRDRRVTEDELMTAVRRQGIGTMDDVEALVLEPTGDVAVVQEVGDASAFDGVLPPDEWPGGGDLGERS